MKKLNEILGINRNTEIDPESHFKNREVGMISAERGNLSSKENDSRTKELHEKLKRSSHNVYPVKGAYTENYGKKNAKKVYENSFIVTAKHAGIDSGVHKTLMNLGKHYEQDSILHKPHHSEMASLYGTNETGYPGMDKKDDVGKFRWDTPGKESEFHTKLPSGKVFSFA